MDSRFMRRFALEMLVLYAFSALGPYLQARPLLIRYVGDYLPHSCAHILRASWLGHLRYSCTSPRTRERAGETLRIVFRRRRFSDGVVSSVLHGTHFSRRTGRGAAVYLEHLC